MADTVSIIFIRPDGSEITASAEIGATLLQVAQEFGIELEGACEGNMACSTCHLIVAEDWYDRLTPPTIDEEDMLDLASGLTATSRLGCQIVVTPDMEGMRLHVPTESRNVMGF